MTETFENEEGLRRNGRRTPLHTKVDAERDPQHEPVHTQQRVRKRRSNASVNTDQYYWPEDEIPEGSSYEWKRWTYVGQEDPFYIAQLRENGGWEPVDPKRHLNRLPKGYNEPYIIRGGQILMERPVELTDEAKAEASMLARRQVKEAEQRLGRTPDGTLTRDHDAVKPKITKEYMRQIPVVED